MSPLPVPTSPSQTHTPVADVQDKYVIGVCVMDNKARSKPMRHILNHLMNYNFDVVIFGDQTILHEDVENWPVCDFLICYFSNGFPLDKAIRYTELRHPFTVNNVAMQSLLRDRRVVLSILDAIRVPTPPRLVVSRDGGVKVDDNAARAFQCCMGLDLNAVVSGYSRNTQDVRITDGGVFVGGKRISKSMIEKPVDAEDHNINVYYSHDKGGGGRRLFRKIGNKSSEFDPQLTRPSGEDSWVYEPLMETEKCEVIKLYTVGQSFIHAETRKSPAVDGLVKRNADGKEVRYSTELSPEEKEIAQKVSNAFGQMVCGLDVLRVNGKSLVIDVNGWSFVKSNTDYYERCAKILSDLFYSSKQCGPSVLKTLPPQIAPVRTWRLKGFVAVCRHADRTPKDKYIIATTAQSFIDLLKGSTQKVVFRQKHQLKLVAAAVDRAIQDASPDRDKLCALKETLEQKCELPGIKVQVKPLFGMNEKVPTKVQVNVKWGGELTHAGLLQSRDFGENLRKDINILNQRALDDVKVLSSSKRQVRVTADLFTRWFLGQLASNDGVISESNELLDDSHTAKEQMDAVKKKLKQRIHLGHEIPQEQLAERGWPNEMSQPSMVMQKVTAILTRLRHIMRQNWATKDVDSLQRCLCGSEPPLFFHERWERMFRRFCDGNSLDENDPVDVSSCPQVVPDPSWIPELYDMLKYDILHNFEFLQAIFSDQESATETDSTSMEHNAYSRRPSTDSGIPVHLNSDVRKLHTYTKVLHDFIVPLEYGILDSERYAISLLIGLPLFQQIFETLADIKNATTPKTRLYFTKASHVHAILNLIYLSGIPSIAPRNTLPELDFLTQITFELYERIHSSGDGRDSSLCVGFSPGAHYASVLDLHIDTDHCLKVAPRKNIIARTSLEQMMACQESYLHSLGCIEH